MGVRTPGRQRDLLLAKKNRAAVAAGASILVVLVLVVRLVVFKPDSWAVVRQSLWCLSEVRMQPPQAHMIQPCTLSSSSSSGPPSRPAGRPCVAA